MQPLMEAGIDSMGATELRDSLSTSTGLDLPATLIFDHPSVALLAKHLAASVAQAELPAAPEELLPEGLSHEEATAQISGIILGLLGSSPPTDQVRQLADAY